MADRGEVRVVWAFREDLEPDGEGRVAMTFPVYDKPPADALPGDLVGFPLLPITDEGVQVGPYLVTFEHGIPVVVDSAGIRQRAHEPVLALLDAAGGRRGRTPPSRPRSGRRDATLQEAVELLREVQACEHMVYVDIHRRIRALLTRLEET